MPGWWDDDSEDEDPRYYSQSLSIYGASWDRHRRAWVCICPEYRRKDICRHTLAFRCTEVIEPKEEYL